MFKLAIILVLEKTPASSAVLGVYNKTNCIGLSGLSKKSRFRGFSRIYLTSLRF
jgi:hypothetical protein